MELSQHNSHFWGSWRVVVFVFILSCIVGGTLIASNLFIYRSLTPFYLYLISTSVLVIFIGCLFILKPSKISFNWPVIIVIGWIAFILLHGILGRTFNPFHIYLIGSLSFLISLYVFFQIEGLKLDALFKIITIIASIEAMFCIGQFFNVFHSYNSYFTVTGSWENPNVTAMFLAMAVPIMMHQIIAEKKLYKYMAIAALSVSILALGMLECRTALIGVIVAVFIILNHRYHITQRLLNKRNRSVSILVTVFFIALLIPTISYVYNAKKASADGRKLVWKLSTEMILEKPLSGYGYGLFEKNYNLFQSNYFKQGSGTETEAQQAGFVRMGYNEFLENAVEGGLPGLVFITALFLMLLSVPVFKNDRPSRLSNTKHEDYFIIAYSGIAAFGVMSICNFTIQAFPAMCLFMIYAGILITHPSLFQFTFNKSGRKSNFNYKIPFGIAGVCIGVCMLYLNVSAANSSMLNERAALQAKSGHNQAAIGILRPLSSDLYTYESYWNNYANTLMIRRDFLGAILLFNKAKAYTSDPEVYLKVAYCYQNEGDFKDAEASYLVAKYIEPARLAPRFALMKIYWKEKDTIKTRSTAVEIINQKLKINTKEAIFYKIQAMQLLKKLGIVMNASEHANRSPITKMPAFLNKSI